MKLITYNVFYKALIRKENNTFHKLQEVISEIDYDIICLQECTRFEEYICYDSMYNVSLKCGVSKIIDVFCEDNISIFFNKKYGLPKNIYCGIFQDHGRLFLVIVFEDFLIINLHYGHYNFTNIYKDYTVYHCKESIGVVMKSDVRAFKNLGELLKCFSGLKIYVCGDFNTGSPETQISENMILGNVNKFLTCSSDDKIIMKEKDLKYAPDHILCNTIPIESYVLKVVGISDHLPVMSIFD